MSKLVKKQAPFFRLLVSTSSKLQRKALIDTITKEQLRALTEITINVLQGVISLTSVYKDKLKKYKTLVTLIGDTSVSAKRKKTALRKNAHAVILLLKSAEPGLKKALL